MQDKEVLDYIKQAFELKAQGCFKQAIEMLYKTLETESSNTEILYQLGDLYFQLQNYNRSEGYLEKVLAINPSHIESYKLLKAIYLRRKEYKSAKTMAEKVFTLEGTSKNLAELIRVLGLCAEYDEAEKYATSTLADDNVLYELANIYYQKNDLDRTKEILNIINPENDDAQILYGKISFDENDFIKSREIFEKFGKNSPRADVLNYLGLFALEDGDYTQAVKLFSKASNIDKAKSIYFYNLGNAYFFNGWMEEATQAYKNAIGLEPENLSYRYSLAYLYYRMKEFEKAKNEVSFILLQDENHISTRVLYALLKFENKDFLGAQAILEKNLETAPEDEFTLSALAKVYSELLIFNKAEKILFDFIGKYPDNLTYLTDFANLYIKEKKYDKALMLIKKISELSENYVDGYVIGAKAAYLKGDYETAKEYALNAVSLDVNNSEAYCWLAKVREKENDFTEAVECMKRAIFYDINNPKYYAEISGLYMALKDYKTAFEYIKDAESLGNDQEYKRMYAELARLCRK